MEFVIRMKTITRTLIFLAAVLVWLVVLVLLNGLYLNVDDIVLVVGALLLSVLTTFGVARALRT
jgi:hypothetical protein